MHFTKKKKISVELLKCKGIPKVFSSGFCCFPVVKICFQMFLSEIFSWHLNIDGFIFPQLPFMSPVQKIKTYFVNKIKYILERWYQIFCFENVVNLVFVSRHTSANAACIHKS